MVQYCPIHEDSELYDDTKECHTCGFGYMVAQLVGERVKLHLHSGETIRGVLADYDVDADIYVVETALNYQNRYTSDDVYYAEPDSIEELPF